ncbi:hypothetical protein VP01_1841g5 [Puccinia sorghi]|uniref:DNA mismatch repair proteins mutS family domain-containing protein n=1 Tax=Puccinia sorghi TaxID=27349 RepID=A0A0L6VEA5_9BASI|nr:hypothetical protein VP01_1841g5 [Puccinia sorghi]
MMLGKSSTRPRQSRSSFLKNLGQTTAHLMAMLLRLRSWHRLATHPNCLGFFATHYSALTEDFKSHAKIATK